GALLPGQLVEQVLGAGQGAARAAGEREEVTVLELPAGVLRGEAAGRGVVDADAHARPGPVTHGHRKQVDPAQATHARRREAQTDLQSATGPGTAIHEPR